MCHDLASCFIQVLFSTNDSPRFRSLLFCPAVTMNPEKPPPAQLQLTPLITHEPCLTMLPGRLSVVT